VKGALAAAVLAAVLPLAPARAEPEDLAPLLEPLRREHDLPALSGAIVRGGELVALGATGVRRRGADEPVSTRDLWHLGSCTKAATATLAARLVERGAIAWDTRVGEVFSEAGDEVHPRLRAVTLEQLLAHRGGLVGELSSLPVWSWLRAHEGGAEEERRTLVAELLSLRPEVAPGSRTLYSNAGYVVAGAMLERAGGAAYEALLRREVLGPLEMRSAGFGPPRGDEPWGHSERGRAIDPARPQADNPAALAPAGALHASLADWARFAALHLRGERGGTGYLRAESFRRLHAPVAGGEYALGWIVTERDWGGGRVLTHAGSNTLWYAVVWLAPLRDFAVLVATNQGGERAWRGVDAAAGRLIEHARRAE
jgi:CubicO group peptidase (beta-lactamase class C family)